MDEAGLRIQKVILELGEHQSCSINSQRSGASKDLGSLNGFVEQGAQLIRLVSPSMKAIVGGSCSLVLVIGRQWHGHQ